MGPRQGDEGVREVIKRRTTLASMLVVASVAAIPTASAQVSVTSASSALPAIVPEGVKRLSDEVKLSRWAYPADRAPIYQRPSTKAKQVGKLRLLTEDGFPEVYLALASWTDDREQEWIRIRIPARPNGRKGWVKVDVLGDLTVNRKQIVVDRKRLRATLYNRGRKIFSARIGVGKASTPTPPGRFWIREKFRVKGAPFYGTHAIGTSAYSATLTDWPGGGVVGLHGTSLPGLIPGRPSHGCIRLKNADISRLYRLAPVGTPIRII